MTVKIKVCKGNACKKRNAQYVLDRACDALGIPENWWTTSDWKVSVEFWWCIWKCDQAV